MLQFVLAFALQANQATITGTVRDATTSEPLKAAVVALVDLNRTILTDSTGAYAFNDVLAGPQHLSVHLVGYGQRTLHALVPASGTLAINVLLHAEPIPIAPVAVRARLALRGAEPNTRAAYPDRSVSAAEVANLPMLAEPDAFQALSGGEVVIMPESPAGVHIRGGAADHTAYVLDGVTILNPYHAAGLFSAWNPDALSNVSVYSATAMPSLPDALAGVVAGESRRPSPRLSARGSFTTTQTRATIDGPIGHGAGFLLSLRSSYPGFIAPRDEGSYLMGESGDFLGSVEAHVFGGRLKLLGYDSENEIETAATANTPSNPTRNAFEWHSRSLGALWSRSGTRSTVEVNAWRATSAEQASWAAGATQARLEAERADEGVVLTAQLRARTAVTNTGVRAVRSKTSYDVVAEGNEATLRSLQTSTPVVSAFAGHSRALSRRLGADVMAALAAVTGKVYPSAQAQLRWLPTERIALTSAISRQHQYNQSLRNPASLVGNVFPVDLHVGAAQREVPVARGDQVIVAAEARPRAGMRIAIQGYARTTDNIVLVAARDSQPFLTGEIESGSGYSRGVALEAALSAARFGFILNYGWQRTRLRHDRGSYTPENGAMHQVETGIIAFPSATTSIRFGVVAAFSRRASRAVGALEWEACNLIDRGCEFAGSPLVSPSGLGRQRLPAYVRADLGGRKHWHIDVGRDASVAVFGTLTNVFGRKNVLNRVFDPATNQAAVLQMRPPSPLVVGLDWRF